METLQLNSFGRAVHHPNFSRKQPFPSTYKRWRIPAVAKTTRPANELSAQDLFELFLQERKITGDLVSKTSDMLWKKEVLEVDESRRAEVKERLQQPQKVTDDESGGGFLKLSRTRKWVSGDGEVPVNETASTVEWKTDSENRKRMGLLEYEALKRELLLITAGIAAACSGYCFFVFSPQVALSYAVGAVARLEEGLFGTVSAKYDRSRSDPTLWWEWYGSGAPELQNFAMRILSQGTSASACERNWSSFDHIHSKKRNRLSSQKLEDLVYVRSNLQLALKNVAKESSNSSTPWIDPVPNATMDDADLYIDSDREFADESGVEASSGFISHTTLDDIELFDITSGQQERQE